jgi:hypothetical protein
MDKKIVIVPLALLLIFSILISTDVASAQGITAGVSKGETFDYTYSLIWTPSDSSATPPQHLVEQNNTQQIQFKITDVSGALLTVDLIRHFKNGSQFVESGTIDLASGTASVPYGFLIVGSNLNKDQRIYPTGEYQIINDTVMRSYPAGQREINIFTVEEAGYENALYFDRIKGVAVDYSFTLSYTAFDYSVTSTEKMVNTNSDVWMNSTSSQTPTPTAVSSATPTPTHATQSPSTGATYTPKPTNGGTYTATASPTSTVEAPLNTPDVLIIGGILLVVVIIALAAALMLKKRRPSKEKKASASEEDFDLSGWNMK